MRTSVYSCLRFIYRHTPLAQRCVHLGHDLFKSIKWHFKQSSFSKFLTRWVHPVQFSNLDSIRPIIQLFGTDRGTGIQEYYIRKFLTQHQNSIQGRTLEVQENLYSKDFQKYGMTVDILHVEPSNPKATLIADLTQLNSLPENQFDCFICTNTLNFIFDLPSAIEGIYKLLKPGGVFLGTVAGVTQISRYDHERWGDYWRFTDKSLEKLFMPLFEKTCSITPYGNVVSAIALLQGLAVEDLEKTELLDKVDLDYQVTLGIFAQKPLPS